MKNKHIFGPVPSRRLGVSLGIDLMPYKICTMNCIYCEVGHTENLTLQRNEYVKYTDVIKELDSYLKNFPKLDYITFSGSGEPTLHSKIGKIVQFLKSNHPGYNIALLTNGSLFTNPEVRNDCLDVDMVLPSLDAVSYNAFIKINRPHSELNMIEIIDGLIQFRKEFTNQIWLEIFIVPGINDSPEEIALLKENALLINPDKIQLNTLDRPCSTKFIHKASSDILNNIAKYFHPMPVEIIPLYNLSSGDTTYNKNLLDNILNLLKRRPCTLADLSRILGIRKSLLTKQMHQLVNDNMIVRRNAKRGKFYLLK